MKILVTGAKGFLGQHVVGYLRIKKEKVVTYDLIDGEDILNEQQLKSKMIQTDVVLHLAAFGDVYMAAGDPVGAAVSGVAGTAGLIKIANECKIKKIVYASTWEVYGEPRYQPLDEKHVCNPDHPYSIAKYGGELMVRSRLNKVPWIILRLGSAYGLRMRPHAVIPLFVRKALAKEPILLQGGGEQVRQFTYTDDINGAFYKALTLPIENEVFNIVTQEAASIRTIAGIITKNIHTDVIVGDKREGDVPSAIVSSMKAERMLDWKASVTLEKGIKQVIDEISGAL